MEQPPTDPRDRFSQEVADKERRKLKGRRDQGRSVWSGLGMFGLIGWSVVVPTLLGALLGIWLDQRYPGGRSKTLTFLLAGLVLGCFNAWRWVVKEDKDMHTDTTKDTDHDPD